MFDLTQGGPQPAIELFRKVPNVKLLACGGDGTVGWLLSVLDKVQISPPPAVSVLPLGTGNDLSRSLGNAQSVLKHVLIALFQVGEVATSTSRFPRYSPASRTPTRSRWTAGYSM